MKTLISSLYFLVTTQLHAQTDSVVGSRFLVSVGPGTTIGKFSGTHLFSINAEVSYSNHRFGRLVKTPGTRVSFFANLLINSFFGGKETYVEGFEYWDFKTTAMTAGIIHNPGRNGFVALTAGPAVVAYSGYIELGGDVNFQGGYFFKRKGVGIKSSIHFMKLKKSEPIIVAGILISRSFK